MLEPKECRKAWTDIVAICGEDRGDGYSPRTTAGSIVARMGLETALEVFATVAEFKKKDGRISPRNRDALETVSVNPESTKREHGNPMFYDGLDAIHTAHIDQIITQLVALRKGE